MTIEQRVYETRELMEELREEAYRARLPGLAAICDRAYWGLAHWKRELDNEPEPAECKACFAGFHEHPKVGDCDCACHTGGRLEIPQITETVHIPEIPA